MLKMGTVERGGSGCMCSEGTFLKAFMRHLLVQRDDVAILDMEAGIEHLGRGTAEAVDVLIVVVEPGGRSVQTAHQVRALASDIGIGDVVAVANKVHDADDAAFLSEALGDIPLLGSLPLSEKVRIADREGRPSWGTDPEVDRALRDIAWSLVERITR
jgi:CO dehydrogenase maturation factor